MGFLGTVLICLLVCSGGSVAQTNRNLERERPPSSQTERRVALVIGNAAYTKAKALTNPANDAVDMAKALNAVGFEVMTGVDQNKRQMEALIRDFGSKLALGGVGLFYYAGHGIQVSGENYLVPVDAEIPEEDEVAYAAVPLGLVLAKMSSAKNALNIIMLDACRNNPFARSWRGFRDAGSTDGLAKISPPTGTLVLYASEPGKVASDGPGRNGLFTESLLQHINKPNVGYDDMVRAISTDVWERSGQHQLPWKEGNSLADFYFVPGGPKVGVTSPVTLLSPPVEQETRKEPLPQPISVPTQQKPLQRKKEAFFTFDLQRCTSEGTTATCELLVTNTAGEDKPFEPDTGVSVLFGSPNPTAIIDDHGNEARIVDVTVANKNGFVRSQLLSNLPVKVLLTFRGVDADARQVKRLVFNFTTKFSQAMFDDFRVEFRDVSLEQPDNGRSQTGKGSEDGWQKTDKTWKADSGFFRFEVTKCFKSGSAAYCDFTVTNDERDLRMIIYGYYKNALYGRALSRVFDEAGGEHPAKGIESGGSGKQGSLSLSLVKGISIKSRIYFEGIDAATVKFSLLEIGWASGGNDFSVQFRDIPFATK